FAEEVREVEYSGIKFGELLHGNLLQALVVLRGEEKYAALSEAIIRMNLQELRVGSCLQTLSQQQAAQLFVLRAVAAEAGQKTAYLLDNPLISMGDDERADMLREFNILTARGCCVFVIDN